VFLGYFSEKLSAHVISNLFLFHLTLFLLLMKIFLFYFLMWMCNTFTKLSSQCSFLFFPLRRHYLDELGYVMVTQFVHVCVCLWYQILPHLWLTDVTSWVMTLTHARRIAGGHAVTCNCSVTSLVFDHSIIAVDTRLNIWRGHVCSFSMTLGPYRWRIYGLVLIVVLQWLTDIFTLNHCAHEHACLIWHYWVLSPHV